MHPHPRPLSEYGERGFAFSQDNTIKFSGVGSMSKKVKVGLIGSQFIAVIHAESFRRCADAELVAVASPTPGNAASFAAKHHIPRHYTDYRELLKSDVDLVVIGAPNHLHCEMTEAAAAAGKHVICE